MLEDAHRARGPAAPPPPPSLLAFCVRVCCLRLSVSLGDSPDACVCACVYVRACVGGSQSISAWLHKGPFSALLQVTTVPLQGVRSNWCMFVGVAVNKGTQCSLKAFVPHRFGEIRGVRLWASGHAKRVCFFRVACSVKTLTSYSSHSYTHKLASHRIPTTHFSSSLRNSPYSHINMFTCRCFCFLPYTLLSKSLPYKRTHARSCTLMRAHAHLTLGAAAWLKSSAKVVGAESDPERNAQHWQAKRSVRRRMEKRALGGGKSSCLHSNCHATMTTFHHTFLQSFLCVFSPLSSVFWHISALSWVRQFLEVSPSHGETAIYL